MIIRKCARCGAPVTPRRDGSPKKVKRFCSEKCQKAAIREGRVRALSLMRAGLGELRHRLQTYPGSLFALDQVVGALQTLGMLRRGEVPR